MPDTFDRWIADRERSDESGILEDGEIVGNWTIKGLIGKGGSAEVYHVFDAEGTSAALKVMVKPHENQVSRRHFARECQILSAGLGVHFPHWYECGVVKGHDYLVEELLLPYDDLPHRRKFVRRWLIEVCEGIARLHAYGFVHRDLKPANVMRRHCADGTDVPVIVDFGLAAPPSNVELADVSRTMIDGRVVVSGTIGYAAPEVITGGDITAAADIHALGVILVKCFGGKVPFGWRTLVRRATSSQQDQRYATISAFVRALRATSGVRWIGALVIVGFAIVVWIFGTSNSMQKAELDVLSTTKKAQGSQIEPVLNKRDADYLKELRRERDRRRIGF